MKTEKRKVGEKITNAQSILSQRIEKTEAIKNGLRFTVEGMPGECFLKENKIFKDELTAIMTGVTFGLKYIIGNDIQNFKNVIALDKCTILQVQMF